jgi:uncharacterized protein YndB with AHSA1/START domain
LAILTGTYRTVDPPRELAFTWRWESGGPGDGVESLVTITFEPVGDRTELTLVHSGFSTPESAAPYRIGWEATFPKLERLFA